MSRLAPLRTALALLALVLLAAAPAEAKKAHKVAYKEGMKSLRLSGAQKVASGQTTVEEILRVTPESQR